MLPLESRLMEIGKIKIGGLGEERTSKGGKKYRPPIKQDYFSIVTSQRDAKGDFIPDQKVTAKLGAKPKEIEVILLHNNIENNWQSYRAMYTGSGKVYCRSEDGETASRAKTEKDIQTGETVMLDERESRTCPCEFASPNKNGAILCKPHGRLSVILPQSEHLGGVYVFRTTSWNTIRNIQGQLEFIKSLTHGLLSGLRFILKVTPKSTHYKDPKSKSMRQTTIFEVGLFYKGNTQQLLDSATKYTTAIMDGRAQMVNLAATKARIEENKYLEDPTIPEEFNPDMLENDIEVPGANTNKTEDPIKEGRAKVDITPEPQTDNSAPLEEKQSEVTNNTQVMF